MEIALKPCNKCGVVQPLDSFYQDRARSDGRRRTCIACDKARKRTPEAHEQSHRYYHSEKGKAAERKYYHEGKGQDTRKAYNDRPEIKERRKIPGRAWSLKWYYSEKGQEHYQALKADPSYLAYRREHQKEWYHRPDAIDENREKARERHHSDQNRAWLKEYSKRPEVIAARRRRHLQRHGIAATLTIEEWQSTLAHFGHRCAYCHRPGLLEQDHFICLAADGPHTANNVVPACRTCNASKQDKPPEEWCPPDVFQQIVAYLSSLG